MALCSKGAQSAKKYVTASESDQKKPQKKQKGGGGGTQFLFGLSEILILMQSANNNQ